jgi:hypothetical protein
MTQGSDQVRYDTGGWISGPCLNEPLPDLTTEEATLLRELQSIWHDKYVIRAVDAWTAQRIGGTEVITADNGFELRPMITQDAINWNREIHGTRSHD